MSSKFKKPVKGGAEKVRLKRSADLKITANDPKQQKLCFTKSNTSQLLVSLQKYNLFNYLSFKYFIN